MTQSFKFSRVSIPGTIYTNGFVWSYRTRAPVGLKTETFLETSASRASNQSAAVPTHRGGCNWVAAVPPFGSVLARRLSNISNLFARVGPFLIRGQRMICNLRRLPATAGKCFSPRTLIKPLQKSLGVLGILLSPFHSAEPLCLGSIACSDGHRVAKGNGHVRHETGQI